jgi:hypothetical protein
LKELVCLVKSARKIIKDKIMKKTNLMIIKIVALFALGCAMACQTNTTPNGSIANQSTNETPINSAQTETKTATNTNQTEIVKTEIANSSSGSLATPTEAYKTAYAARQSKDIQGLKRVMSKDMLEFFTLIGEDQKDGVDGALMQMTEKPQGASDETRNEKITGNTATVEYLDEQGKWKTMDFIKEGSEWKLTIPNAKSQASQDIPQKTK